MAIDDDYDGDVYGGDVDGSDGNGDHGEMVANVQDAGDGTARIDTLEKAVQGLASQVTDLTALNKTLINQLSGNASMSSNPGGVPVNSAVNNATTPGGAQQPMQTQFASQFGHNNIYSSAAPGGVAMQAPYVMGHMNTAATGFPDLTGMPTASLASMTGGMDASFVLNQQLVPLPH